MAITLIINHRSVEISEEQGDMPLLWFLRDEQKLTGTKYGCGIGQCGACTVHVDGDAIRSCSIPINALIGKKITTIEGLATDAAPHPVQTAWQEIDVPQCGYCQSGQIMAAVSLLEEIPNPSDEDISQRVTNICRCGTYPRVRKAIKQAATHLAKPAK